MANIASCLCCGLLLHAHVKSLLEHFSQQTGYVILKLCLCATIRYNHVFDDCICLEWCCAVVVFSVLCSLKEAAKLHRTFAEELLQRSCCRGAAVIVTGPQDGFAGQQDNLKLLLNTSALNGL